MRADFSAHRFQRPHDFEVGAFLPKEVGPAEEGKNTTALAAWMFHR